MPLLVLFQILTGRLWVFEGGMRDRRNVLRAVGLGGAVFWMAASSLSYYPHFLSYFNGLVRDKKNAYRVLADSNLDWKQNRRYLDRYLKSQGLSRANLNPTWPREGTWIVSANRLVGVNHPSEYRWLRRLTPHGHVFFSHLRFRLQEEDLRKALGFNDGRLLQASSLRRNDLVRGIWRVGYPGNSPKGEACGTKALRGLSVRRVCRRSDHFFARFLGYLRIPETGEYMVSLGSDDGSRLFLGGKKIIDLWGDHGLLFDHAIVSLEEGFHPMEIQFYEKTGAARLRLRVARFPRGRRLFPGSLFYRESTAPGR